MLPSRCAGLCCHVNLLSGVMHDAVFADVLMHVRCMRPCMQEAHRFAPQPHCSSAVHSTSTVQLLRKIATANVLMLLKCLVHAAFESTCEPWLDDMMLRTQRPGCTPPIDCQICGLLRSSLHNSGCASLHDALQRPKDTVRPHYAACRLCAAFFPPKAPRSLGLLRRPECVPSLS